MRRWNGNRHAIALQLGILFALALPPAPAFTQSGSSEAEPCPEGEVRLLGKCSKLPDADTLFDRSRAKCPAGKIRASGKCIALPGNNLPDVFCSETEKYDRKRGRCVSDISCHRGTVRNGKCICPAGHIRQAVSVKAFRCQRAGIICDGGTVTGNACTCPPTTERKRLGRGNYKCRPLSGNRRNELILACKGGQIVVLGACRCPRGARLVGGQCKCRGGRKISGDRCVAR